MDAIFLSHFFNSSKEAAFNKQIEGPISDGIEQQVLAYIHQVIDIPLRDYLLYLKEYPRNTYITSENITQASHIELCHIEMCQAFMRANYKALDLSQIGWYLHNDGKVRARATEAKYGENVKGAMQLGLTYSKGGKWLLSCLGYLYPKLNSYERGALVSRILFRDPLYSQIFIDALEKDVSVTDYMCGVSESTIKRRIPSVMAFCNIVIKEADIEGISLFHLISR